jgi:hypothetical protein
MYSGAKIWTDEDLEERTGNILATLVEKARFYVFSGAPEAHLVNQVKKVVYQTLLAQAPAPNVAFIHQVSGYLKPRYGFRRTTLSRAALSVVSGPISPMAVHEEAEGFSVSPVAAATRKPPQNQETRPSKGRGIRVVGLQIWTADKPLAPEPQSELEAFWKQRIVFPRALPDRDIKPPVRIQLWQQMLTMRDSWIPKHRFYNSFGRLIQYPFFQKSELPGPENSACTVPEEQLFSRSSRSDQVHEMIAVSRAGSEHREDWHHLLTQRLPKYRDIEKRFLVLYCLQGKSLSQASAAVQRPKSFATRLLKKLSVDLAFVTECCPVEKKAFGLFLQEFLSQHLQGAPR